MSVRHIYIASDGVEREYRFEDLGIQVGDHPLSTLVLCETCGATVLRNWVGAHAAHHGRIDAWMEAGE